MRFEKFDLSLKTLAHSARTSRSIHERPIGFGGRSCRTCIEKPFSGSPFFMLTKGLRFAILQFPFECFVKNGWEQGIEFGGGLGLEPFKNIHFRLENF